MAETPSELLAEIEKLERKHLENPRGRYFVPLANAYRKIGELDHAEMRLREGLRTHPDYLSAHIVLGRVLADRGANSEAADEFRYVLAVDPQNLIALRTLGELAMAEGRTEEAGRWYRELLGVDPMNDEARQALSVLDARASAPADDEQAAEVEGEPEEFEGGGWWTQPEPPSEDAGAAPLEGLAHGPVDDWAGPAVGVDVAPPAEDEAQAYAGGTDGEFVAGEYVADPYLTELSDDDDAEFVTETIAELYARQGFYDRAADVYRELIRQRGEEAGLVRRLAEVEWMAAGEPPLSAPLEPAEALPVLDAFDFGALDADTPTAAEAEPESEPEFSAPSSGTEGAPAADRIEFDTFAGSFQGGFAGQNGEDAEHAAPAAEEPAAEPEPHAAVYDAAEPDAEVIAHGAAPGTTVAGMLGELLAWRAPEAAAAVEPEAEEPLPSFSFDEYFAAEVADTEPEEATEPEIVAASPVAESVGDEEDLESFQAWLRSLKR